MRLMDVISKERNGCMHNHKKYPDNVMIHPVNKINLKEEAMRIAGFQMPKSKMTRCFDMKVIWTKEIEEHEVICTFNGR